PLRQDEDVLDTWFSSALWPFATLGWPEATPELERFYPGSVLVTGFDIIFFWVARMMMMGLKFMGEVPFSDVYITGLIRDEHGDKMSKSRGNVIDPLDIVDGITLDELIAKRTTGLMQQQLAPAIERATRRQYPDGIAPHGTDALRFTFAALASPNRDIRFDLARVGGYRNFCNKLWNAARFVTLTLGEAAPPAGESVELSVADRWIRARFGRMLAAVESAFRDYRFDYAANALYEFTWYDFCDWYLELTKPLLQAETVSAAAKRGTRRTLAQVLEALQRALHPLMPFITEEIWQRLAGLASITLLGAGERAPPSAPALVGSLTVLVPLAGLIDAAAEAARLGKLLAKTQGDLAKARERLANEDFVRGAPAEVVARERERVAELERTAKELSSLLEIVRKLLPP